MCSRRAAADLSESERTRDGRGEADDLQNRPRTAGQRLAEDVKDERPARRVCAPSRQLRWVELRLSRSYHLLPHPYAPEESYEPRLREDTTDETLGTHFLARSVRDSRHDAPRFERFCSEKWAAWFRSSRSDLADVPAWDTLFRAGGRGEYHLRAWFCGAPGSHELAGSILDQTQAW